MPRRGYAAPQICQAHPAPCPFTIGTDGSGSRARATTTHRCPTMITIRFISANQTEQTITAATGQSLMKAAVDANVAGVEADCGGTLTCATCHVMLEPEWLAKLPPPVPDELDMLDFAATAPQVGSRLSCQIQLTPELDGMSVHLPASQH